MPSLIGVTGGDGVQVAANYLRVLPSPGAALTGVTNGAPLMTFNTPNLQMFKVTITGEDLTATPTAANSAWSQVIRAIQVTSEVFAVFAPEYDTITEGASTFCFLAPDFNTNTGAASVAGSAQTAIAESGGGSSILETAIQDAVGGTATVTRVALTGVTVA
jgi:hypothetical protein